MRSVRGRPQHEYRAAQRLAPAVAILQHDVRPALGVADTALDVFRRIARQRSLLHGVNVLRAAVVKNGQLLKAVPPARLRRHPLFPQQRAAAVQPDGNGCRMPGSRRIRKANLARHRPVRRVVYGQLDRAAAAANGKRMLRRRRDIALGRGALGKPVIARAEAVHRNPALRVRCTVAEEQRLRSEQAAVQRKADARQRLFPGALVQQGQAYACLRRRRMNKPYGGGRIRRLLRLLRQRKACGRRSFLKHIALALAGRQEPPHLDEPFRIAGEPLRNANPPPVPALQKERQTAAGKRHDHGLFRQLRHRAQARPLRHRSQGNLPPQQHLRRTAIYADHALRRVLPAIGFVEVCAGSYRLRTADLQRYAALLRKPRQQQRIAAVRIRLDHRQAQIRVGDGIARFADPQNQRVLCVRRTVQPQAHGSGRLPRTVVRAQGGQRQIRNQPVRRGRVRSAQPGQVIVNGGNIVLYPLDLPRPAVVAVRVDRAPGKPWRRGFRIGPAQLRPRRVLPGRAGPDRGLNRAEQLALRDGALGILLFKVLRRADDTVALLQHACGHQARKHLLRAHEGIGALQYGAHTLRCALAEKDRVLKVPSAVARTGAGSCGQVAAVGHQVVAGRIRSPARGSVRRPAFYSILPQVKQHKGGGNPAVLRVARHVLTGAAVGAEPVIGIGRAVIVHIALRFAQGRRRQLPALRQPGPGPGKERGQPRSEAQQRAKPPHAPSRLPSHSLSPSRINSHVYHICVSSARDVSLSVERQNKQKIPGIF